MHRPPLSCCDTTGFARVTTRHIIEHLYTNYGRITIEMLPENKTKMKEPWDITTPIKLLFAQIGDGQAYARAGGKPYTEPQLVRISYHNIEATKRMEIACREWRAKPAANKTWTNLKLDMKTAHLDLGLTMTTAGYWRLRCSPSQRTRHQQSQSNILCKHN